MKLQKSFAIKDGNEVIEELYDRIVGRYTIDAIVNPDTGEVIAEADSMIKEDEAEKIIRCRNRNCTNKNSS